MSCDLSIQDVSTPAEFESDENHSIGPTDEKAVLHVPGPISTCEVWFDVPFDWLRGTVVRTYGVVGSVRLKLTEVDLKMLAPETSGGRGKGLAFTVQGRPASAYEITVQRAAGSPTTAGRFFARAWMGMDQAPVATAGTARDLHASSTRFGVTTATVTRTADGSLAYLFQPGGRTRVEIDRVSVSYYGTSGTGYVSLLGGRIITTGDPGVSPTEDIPALDGSGATSNAYLVGAATNPPDVAVPDLFSTVVAGAADGHFEWTAEASGGPIILRAGRCEGIDVRADVSAEFDGDFNATVSFAWREVEEPPVDLAHLGFVHEWDARDIPEVVTDVETWTDRLSGAVLSIGSNKPSRGSDDDGPYVEFDDGNSERLDATLSIDAAADYTIVLAIVCDDDGIVFDAHGTTAEVAVRRSVATTWLVYAKNNAGTDEDTTVADDSRFVGRVVIVRHSGNLVTIRSGGVTGSSLTISGAATITGVRLGGHHGGSDFVDMRLRHFAIADRALTDDECLAVEGLMATYWNIR